MNNIKTTFKNTVLFGSLAIIFSGIIAGTLGVAMDLWKDVLLSSIPFWIMCIVSPLIFVFNKNASQEQGWHIGSLCLIVSFQTATNIAILLANSSKYSFAISYLITLFGMSTGVLFWLFKQKEKQTKRTKTFEKIFLSVFWVVVVSLGILFSGRHGALLMEKILGFEGIKAFAWILFIFMELLMSFTGGLLIAIEIIKKLIKKRKIQKEK